MTWITPDCLLRVFAASWLIDAGSRTSPHLRHPPAKPDEEKPPVVKELRRLPLECVADELKDPTDDEHGEGPLPQPENRERGDEHGERHHDQRDAERMAHPVDRVLMARRVPGDPLVGRAISEHGRLRADTQARAYFFTSPAIAWTFAFRRAS